MRKGAKPFHAIERLDAGKEGFLQHLRYLDQAYAENISLTCEEHGQVPRIWRSLTFTHFYNKLTAGVCKKVVKLENYQEEMSTLLSNAAPDIFSKDAIMQELKVSNNASVRNKYQDYYDDRAIELVSSRDGSLINKFDYGF